MVKKKQTIEYLDTEKPIDNSTYKYFLGIDPSYSSSGIVLLNSDPNVSTPLIAITIKAGLPKQTFIERMTCLLNSLEKLLSIYPPEEVLVVMEGASFASEFGAFKLGKLSGVLEYWLSLNNYKYYLVAPMYVKKVACSIATATKEQVINGVRSRWHYINNNDDINDAYVMARIAQGAIPINLNKNIKKKKERLKNYGKLH